MNLAPITRDQAMAFVSTEHRHNRRAVAGWRFGVGLFTDSQLVGVGIAGRCTSRVLDTRGAGHWIEVTRVATDGTPNGCSMLYGALLRAAKALGYCRAYTYTLSSEGGASLHASGWAIDAHLPVRRGWDSPGRRRDESEWPTSAKVRWIQSLRPCSVHA